MEDKITELTKLWYEIVNTDHHKDRDCHWYITKSWSYGEKPVYIVEHDGYIYDEEVWEEFNTYEEAEEFLYQILKDAIYQEEEWAKKVISEGYDSNKDTWSVGKYAWDVAKEILKVIDEYKKSN